MFREKIVAIKANFDSGNSLLPDGTKPLPESMLSYHQLATMTLMRALS